MVRLSPTLPPLSPTLCRPSPTTRRPPSYASLAASYDMSERPFPTIPPPAKPENSPALQSWVNRPVDRKSPQGRKTLSSPTGLSGGESHGPSHEWLGYSRWSPPSTAPPAPLGISCNFPLPGFCVFPCLSAALPASSRKIQHPFSMNPYFSDTSAGYNGDRYHAELSLSN